MAIGNTHILDTAVHEYSIQQSMISHLSMDLRRERKRSFKLHEMKQAQDEDRKERQKIESELTKEKKRQQTLWLKKIVC